MTLSQTKLQHAATRLIYLGPPIFFTDSESAQQREDDLLGGCEVSGRGSGRQRKSLQEVRGVRALGHWQEWEDRGKGGRGGAGDRGPGCFICDDTGVMLGVEVVC